MFMRESKTKAKGTFGGIANWLVKLAVLTACLAAAGVLLDPGTAASPAERTCLTCGASR